MSRLALILAVLLVSGCASSGYIIETGNKKLTKPFIESIEKGKTTKQEILSALGQPQFKTQAGILGEMWTYSRSQERHYAKNFFSGDEVSGFIASACITFDGDIVKDVTLSEVNPYQDVTLQRF